MKKIFISHCSKDKNIADIFVDKILENGMGFNHTEIFCTSIEGLGIKTGKDWRNSIQENLLNAKVIILLITPNYRESEICLTEMGAAWASDKFVIPIIVPPIDFENLSVVYKVKQALNITKGPDLDTLRDDLKEFLSIEQPPTSTWSTKKQEGILLINNELEQTTFNSPLLRKEFDELNRELLETKQALKSIVKEKQQLLEYCKNLEKTKDKEVVEDIKQKSGLIDEYESFIRHSEELGDTINNLDFPIRKILFNYLSGKKLSLNQNEMREYKSKLQEAMADDIIDEECDININHKKISQIIQQWNNYEKFFNKLKDETISIIDSKFDDVTISIDNLTFWREILKVKI